MKLNLRLTDDNIGDIILLETEDNFTIKGEILNVTDTHVELKDIDTRISFTIFLFEINEIEILRKVDKKLRHRNTLECKAKAVGPGSFLKIKIDEDKLNSNINHPIFGKLSHIENSLTFSKLDSPRHNLDHCVCQYTTVNGRDGSYMECLSFIESAETIGVSFYECNADRRLRYLIVSCAGFSMIINLHDWDLDKVRDSYNELLSLLTDEKRLKVVYGGPNLFLFLLTHCRVRIHNFIDVQILHYGLHNIRVSEPMRQLPSYADTVQLLFNVVFKIGGDGARYTDDDVLNKLAFNARFLVPMYDLMVIRLLEPVRLISDRVCCMNINDQEETFMTKHNLSPRSSNYVSVLPRSLQFWSYCDTSVLMHAKQIVDKELSEENQDGVEDIVDINRKMALRQEEMEQVVGKYGDNTIDDDYGDANSLWGLDGSRGLEIGKEDTANDTSQVLNEEVTKKADLDQNEGIDILSRVHSSNVTAVRQDIYMEEKEASIDVDGVTKDFAVGLCQTKDVSRKSELCRYLKKKPSKKSSQPFYDVTNLRQSSNVMIDNDDSLDQHVSQLSMDYDARNPGSETSRCYPTRLSISGNRARECTNNDICEGGLVTKDIVDVDDIDLNIDVSGRCGNEMRISCHNECVNVFSMESRDVIKDANDTSIMEDDAGNDRNEMSSMTVLEECTGEHNDNEDNDSSNDDQCYELTNEEDGGMIGALELGTDDDQLRMTNGLYDRICEGMTKVNGIVDCNAEKYENRRTCVANIWRESRFRRDRSKNCGPPETVICSGASVRDNVTSASDHGHSLGRGLSPLRTCRPPMYIHCNLSSVADNGSQTRSGSSNIENVDSLSSTNVIEDLPLSNESDYCELPGELWHRNRRGRLCDHGVRGTTKTEAQGILWNYDVIYD